MDKKELINRLIWIGNLPDEFSKDLEIFILQEQINLNNIKPLI